MCKKIDSKQSSDAFLLIKTFLFFMLWILTVKVFAGENNYAPFILDKYQLKLANLELETNSNLYILDFKGHRYLIFVPTILEDGKWWESGTTLSMPLVLDEKNTERLSEEKKSYSLQFYVVQKRGLRDMIIGFDSFDGSLYAFQESTDNRINNMQDSIEVRKINQIAKQTHRVYFLNSTNIERHLKSKSKPNSLFAKLYLLIDLEKENSDGYIPMLTIQQDNSVNLYVYNASLYENERERLRQPKFSFYLIGGNLANDSAEYVVISEGRIYHVLGNIVNMKWLSPLGSHTEFQFSLIFDINNDPLLVRFNKSDGIHFSSLKDFFENPHQDFSKKMSLFKLQKHLINKKNSEEISKINLTLKEACERSLSQSIY
ncbi:MAG: hypothetical protein KDD40_00470 [Bdellovibrionales bacterium]|nr:hypothetical protein [Bdellovibrionales bacterium]